MAATAGLDPRAVEAITNLSSAIDDWLQQGLRAIVESAAFWATVGILAAFLTFFFLQDGDGGWRWCIQAARGSQRDRLTAAGASALSRSGGHLRRTAARSALDAVALLVVLVVLDIQPAGALAVLMFIGGFVPYVGRLAAGTVVVLVALASAGASLAACSHSASCPPRRSRPSSCRDSPVVRPASTPSRCWWRCRWAQSSAGCPGSSARCRWRSWW
jgi:predicted PurR-regulated permease PerM